LTRQNAFESTVPAHHQNQFGGAGGGPIIKNKLFAFESMNSKKYAVPVPPTSGLCRCRLSSWRFQLGPTPIIDPLNGQPFAGNQIPTDRISAFAKTAQQSGPPK